jgi:hypothetical protein
MPPDACEDRASLSRDVVDAVAVYRAKTDYDSSKQKCAPDIDALAVELQKARGAERAAVRALDDHVKQHGCTA